ncbi:MAG: tRNA (adenosine(37)-N6)-threonylcarbamoyltransferase complex dimerization subunit type 1 TsaB [Bryobacterales bacterium]|nr:tRNA (adenosine(37)-N6)-threonylcarbamoyltransferase complex dimerization subunit type 1 TsaB [Bryobacterales bacterium]
MKLLAVDTARREGSIALLRDGAAVAEVSLGTGPGFGETLFQSIQALLSEHSLALSDLDGYAAATGPGSFTGIRVGLAAAKALAETSGKPIIGVSNLRALASMARGAAVRVPVLDARRGGLFAGFYDADTTPIRPDMFCDWTGLEPELERLSATLVSNERELFAAGGGLAAAPVTACQTAPTALAAAVARLAAGELAAGRAGKPEEVDANYIRRPNARLPLPPQPAKR